MPRKSPSPEQIIGKLRQVEVLVSQGNTVAMACREAGITEQTYYRLVSGPSARSFTQARG